MVTAMVSTRRRVGVCVYEERRTVNLKDNEESKSGGQSTISELEITKCAHGETWEHRENTTIQIIDAFQIEYRIR